MFQKNSLFRQMSLFADTTNGLPHNERPRYDNVEEVKEPTIQVTRKQLEDWSHRLQAAAYEAGDEHLRPLESDLLDLRDELVAELHLAL